MRLAAIHQPNFFPWLGYFDKIRRSSAFVFLDHVAYPKSGSGMGTIVNRVRIDINGEGRWIGCPVVREPGEQIISRVRIDNRTDWRAKVLRSIELSYRRALNFSRVMPAVESLMRNDAPLLADFNVHAVRALAALLGLAPQFHRQSELEVAGKATQLLIAIARRVGADSYLCGGGSAGYQQDEFFSGTGIALVYQNFTPRPYGNSSRFVPGLSVIDYLMRVPAEKWADGYWR